MCTSGGIIRVDKFKYDGGCGPRVPDAEMFSLLRCVTDQIR